MNAEYHGLLDEHAEGLRKPLYLQGQSGLVVELDERALRIRQPERAATFYPLARLARVLSKGEVRWSCEALLGCADAGVPVVFMDRDGGVRGYLFGPSSGEDALYRCLRACLRRSGGRNRYASWRCAMADHARRTLEAQLRQAGAGPDSVLAGCGGTPVGRGMAGAVLDDATLRRLRGLLAGLSAQLLAEAGLSAEQLADLEPLNLVDDLADLLGWALVEPVLAAARLADLEPDQRDGRALTALVEARRNEVFRFGRLLLDRLRQWLED